MMFGQQHDASQAQTVGCCHQGCFLIWAGRQHRARRRQGTTAEGRQSTSSKVEAASSPPQGSGVQPLAFRTPAGGTGRPSVAEVAAEAGPNGPQRREVAMITTKESVKRPGGGDGTFTLPESHEPATFSTEHSLSGPLAMGPNVGAAGPWLNHGGCNDRHVAAHARLNPSATVAVTDDKTFATRSTVDGEQPREEVYKDSLCEPTDILNLAKEAEQQALREMEEAMLLMREVTKRRMEMATKNAKLPADSLGVPPVSSTEAATREVQAVNPDLQRISRHPQQHENSLSAPAGQVHNDARVGDTEEVALGSPLNAANLLQQGRSAASSPAYEFAVFQEEPLQASHTPPILEEGTGFDIDAVASVRASTRRKKKGHTVLLDSSQVVSGSVSCPFSSLCFSACNMCFEEEKVPEPTYHI